MEMSNVMWSDSAQNIIKMTSDQPKQQQQQLMLKFATDLKSRNEGIRNKAAKD